MRGTGSEHPYTWDIWGESHKVPNEKKDSMGWVLSPPTKSLNLISPHSFSPIYIFLSNRHF